VLSGFDIQNAKAMSRKNRVSLSMAFVASSLSQGLR